MKRKLFRAVGNFVGGISTVISATPMTRHTLPTMIPQSICSNSENAKDSSMKNRMEGETWYSMRNDDSPEIIIEYNYSQPIAGQTGEPG